VSMEAVTWNKAAHLNGGKLFCCHECGTLIRRDDAWCEDAGPLCNSCREMRYCGAAQKAPDADTPEAKGVQQTTTA
jgi:hypothetical protein